MLKNINKYLNKSYPTKKEIYEKKGKVFPTLSLN